MVGTSESVRSYLSPPTAVHLQKAIVPGHRAWPQLVEMLLEQHETLVAKDRHVATFHPQLL